MIEGARRQPRRRTQQIADHHRDARLHRVQYGVVAGEPHEIALHFEPYDTALRYPRGQAQHRGSGAAADIEDQLMRLGRHCRGKKNRVDCDTITFGRLT